LPVAANPDGFDDFLNALQEQVATSHPHLLSLYDVFRHEAVFGRKWLNSNLSALAYNASILEVGGGVMLLSSELQREGYAVTVLEPIGDGFSVFTELQNVVLRFAQERNHAPNVIAVCVEAFQSKDAFDFAFSVNVMEHVKSVSKALVNVSTALKPAATYRFTCPNYLFPYEPHFNILTLFSKKLTERVLSRKIFGSSRVSDSRGVWDSLNWISVPMISRVVKSIPGVRAQFDRTIFSGALDRVVADDHFASRRSMWIRITAVFFVKTRLSKIFTWLPAWLLPIVDCSVSRS
jgi:2-polyprenyl-3-methyl-5-hydroxy-6-metoxy-1,4-benzoquinol methylase